MRIFDTAFFCIPITMKLYTLLHLFRSAKQGRTVTRNLEDSYANHYIIAPFCAVNQNRTGISSLEVRHTSLYTITAFSKSLQSESN